MRINTHCKKCSKEMINVYHTKRYCEDCLLILDKQSHKKAELKRIGTRTEYYEKNKPKRLENYHKKHHKELICSNCNNLFMQKRKCQKYCSLECLKQKHYLNNKERYNKMGILRYEKLKEENPNYAKEEYQKYVQRENKRRKELGLSLVGKNFRRETEMFVYINYLFPNEEIVFHDRKTLNGLELDAFIPGLKLAFEYMGRQHFEEGYLNSIFVLTEERFKAQKFRDEKKNRIV